MFLLFVNCIINLYIIKFIVNVCIYMCVRAYMCVCSHICFPEVWLFNQNSTAQKLSEVGYCLCFPDEDLRNREVKQLI